MAQLLPHLEQLAQTAMLPKQLTQETGPKKHLETGSSDLAKLVLATLVLMLLLLMLLE